MKPTPTACAAIILAVVGTSQLSAQCIGVNSCTTTNTVSVTVGALVSLDMSSTTTTLTNPTATDIQTGTSILDAGPTFTIRANRSWTLNIRSLNAASWTYVGSFSGVKPIGDLAWSTSSGGTFTAITSTDALFTSGATASSGTPAQAFFRTSWSTDFGSTANAPGVYSLPVAFTLTAP